MKIFLCQLNPKVGDFQGNADKILTAIRSLENKSDRVDLCVFPELITCGYPPKDLLLKKDFLQRLLKSQYEELFPQIKIPSLIGGVFQDEKTKALYNSLFFVENGQVKKIIKKNFLPNYEVFNESRYFHSASTEDIKENLIEIGIKKVGVFICEDLLGLEDNFESYDRKNYFFTENTEKLDLIICSAASPYRQGQKTIRQNIAKKVSDLFKCPVALVNQVGTNDNIIFDGNSFILGNNNIACAEAFKEDFILSDINNINNFQANENKKTEKEKIIELKDAIVCGIKDYFHKTGFKKALLGLSGGIDSALVLCLACEALGKDNVSVLLMPSKYSSKESLEDALELAKRLNIYHEIINIDSMLEAFLQTGKFSALTLAEENAQARIRGMLLMGRANRDNSLLLNTSNKSELAVGYSTLYGDSCGALAPIGDLWKTQVWEMAEKMFIEIPRRIIEKEPSAELRPEQKDSDSIPEYEILDNFLREYIEENKTLDELVNAGYEPELIKKVLRLLSMSQFKRRQFPIILKLTKQSFSTDWVFPVSASW